MLVGKNRPQGDACGGAKRRGASDDDRREEGPPRHPPMGLAEGDRSQKKDFFWVRGGERKKWIFFAFDGGG